MIVVPTSRLFRMFYSLKRGKSTISNLGVQLSWSTYPLVISNRKRGLYVWSVRVVLGLVWNEGWSMMVWTEWSRLWWLDKRSMKRSGCKFLLQQRWRWSVAQVIMAFSCGHYWLVTSGSDPALAGIFCFLLLVSSYYDVIPNAKHCVVFWTGTWLMGSTLKILSDPSWGTSPPKVVVAKLVVVRRLWSAKQGERGSSLVGCCTY